MNDDTYETFLLHRNYLAATALAMWQWLWPNWTTQDGWDFIVDRPLSEWMASRMCRAVEKMWNMEIRFVSVTQHKDYNKFERNIGPEQYDCTLITFFFQPHPLPPHHILHPLPLFITVVITIEPLFVYILRILHKQRKLPRDHCTLPYSWVSGGGVSDAAPAARRSSLLIYSRYRPTDRRNDNNIIHWRFILAGNHHP